MAKAKKLKSGNWRVLVYSRTEHLLQKDGTTKKVRRYESFTAKTKKEAEFLAADFALNKKRKNDTSNFTVREAMEQYIASKNAILSPSTVREYTRSAKTNLKGIQHILLSDIDNNTIQNEVNRQALTHSPKTLRDMVGLLSATFNVFNPDFKLRISYPQKTKKSMYIPTDNDIATIVKSIAGTNMEIPIMLAAFGSMRRSEICAVYSDDINGNLLTVSKAMVLNVDRKWVIKVPKTYAGYRNIEFPQFVIDKLSGITGKIVNVTPNYITKKFKTLLENVNIQHFRFHDLRHYQASILHSLGIPTKYIMERGGWSSDTVVKDIYTHTMINKSEETASVANAHFESIMQHEIQHEK